MLTFKEALDVRATNSDSDDLGYIKQVDSKQGGNLKDDMETFDQLGPKTRDVLQNKMPIKWSAAKTLDSIKRMGMDPLKHDDMIARQMTSAVDMVYQKLKANPNMNTQQQV